MTSRAVRRVVSLLPASTEIVHALGHGDRLVGRSHECDHPPGVEGLPVCTEPRVGEGTGAGIQERVEDLLREGLAIYLVDAGTLRALRPDLVITQTQCQVCAVSEETLVEALLEWVDDRPRILSLRPDTLADVLRDMVAVARALGDPDAGDALVGGLRRRMQAVAHAATRPGRRPRVGCLEWLDPLMGAGHWMPELVSLAGGESAFGTAGARAPWLDWEELQAADPDVIVAMPCGLDIDRSRSELGTLSRRPGWHDLRAVREGRVAVADGNRFFNRPGPRVAEALEIMAEILQPGVLDYGHRGAGWEPWTAPDGPRVAGGRQGLDVPTSRRRSRS